MIVLDSISFVLKEEYLVGTRKLYRGELIVIMTSKRIRSGRVSEEQLVAMVDFLEQNKGVAQGKFLAVNGKEMYDAKWCELAEDLNRLRGVNKTVAQWQTTWRDLKSRTSIKIRNIRNGRAATGNKEIVEGKVSPLDQRVVGLIGVEYIGGSAVCPDSIPEEEDLLHRLIAGDHSVAELPPTVPNIMSNLLQEDQEAMEEFVNDDLMEPAHRSLQHYDNITTLQDKENINIDKAPLNSKETKRNYLNQPMRKRTSMSKGNRSRIGTQLQTARQEFADISNKHAEAMMMLAEAAKIQAESSVRLANAAEKQAEAVIQQATNDARRTEVFNKLTDVLYRILPEYAE